MAKNMAPPSTFSKLLIQKDGHTHGGNFPTKFFIKYRDDRRNIVCYDNCKPIETGIKEEDPKSKVFSYNLTPFEGSEVELYVTGRPTMAAALRYDWVISPKVDIEPSRFPKVVSMFKDRADQI